MHVICERSDLLRTRAPSHKEQCNLCTHKIFLSSINSWCYISTLVVKAPFLLRKKKKKEEERTGRETTLPVAIQDKWWCPPMSILARHNSSAAGHLSPSFSHRKRSEHLLSRDRCCVPVLCTHHWVPSWKSKSCSPAGSSHSCDCHFRLRVQSYENNTNNKGKEIMPQRLCKSRVMAA